MVEISSAENCTEYKRQGKRDHSRGLLVTVELESVSFVLANIPVSTLSTMMRVQCTRALFKEGCVGRLATARTRTTPGARNGIHGKLSHDL